MIKKIFTTEFDLFNLSVKRTQIPEAPKHRDFKGMVVTKPWGYEYLMLENAFVAVWILFLKPDARTSMHCHPKKKTSLLVLEGVVNTSSLDTQFELKALDGLVIDRGVFHSTQAASKEGAFIMEIETPPQKTDLVRLKDEYGRENKAYEGDESLITDLKDFEYSDFHKELESSERRVIEKLIKSRKINFHSENSWKDFLSALHSSPFRIVSLLDKNLKIQGLEMAMEAGEIFEAKWLIENIGDIKPPQGEFCALTIE
ncbi:MAG: hypothetical protein A3D92_12200 [Bacteroidetes bacterium RIFCSPHIGHO2_02_FULL_44_7]|nr:MAG: hypothetical protein A3D92_12200 [Bacteroidetes bacterium RIFCSPHIGHO2_02_FULL_44_7]